MAARCVTTSWTKRAAVTQRATAMSTFLAVFFGQTVVEYTIRQYNTTLLPSVNTIARGMFCGARYTHHTLTPIIKHH